MTRGPIIVFDSNCVLCSGMVAFVLRHEREPVLRFVSSQSNIGRSMAAEHGITAEDLDRTFLVIDGLRALKRSNAALEIARHLRRPWNWAQVVRIIPRPLRDWVYDRIALNRYDWFGQRNNCVFVPPDQRHRFLSS